MLKQTYTQRMKQRVFYYKAGLVMMLMGFSLFVIIYVARSLSLYWIALFLTGSGIISALWLSRVGWSRHLIVDLILNQISVLMIILGIGFFLFDGGLNPEGIISAIIGLLLVGLGINYHSPVDVDELDGSNML